jgi:hypothetical protein
MTGLWDVSDKGAPRAQLLQMLDQCQLVVWADASGRAT